MAWWKLVLVIAGALVLAHFLLGAASSFFPRTRVRGNRAKGLVVFVEGIRWLSVKWDRKPCQAGLRQAGYEGDFVYWKWHSAWRAWLALPVIMDSSLMDRQGRRLAEFICRQHRNHPSRPLYLMSSSCGAEVMLRALELLPPDVRVDSAAMLASAVSPSRDLSGALPHVRGPLVVTTSLADCLLLGAGTLLFGTADRRHTPSAGMVGLRPRGAWSEKVIEIHWRPAMIAIGQWGGHFTSPDMIAQKVAPAMGITKRL